MRFRKLPPCEYARECFKYDAETGNLIWRYRPRSHFNRDYVWRNFNKKYAGKLAGTIALAHNGTPYKNVSINCVIYRMHRMVWLIVKGSDPIGELDHINNDTLDNRVENLRPATRSQQNQNKRAIPSKIGIYKGVRKIRENGYSASIKIKGKEKYLGYFSSPEAAHAAYSEAAKELFGEYANTGKM